MESQKEVVTLFICGFYFPKNEKRKGTKLSETVSLAMALKFFKCGLRMSKWRFSMRNILQ